MTDNGTKAALQSALDVATDSDENVYHLSTGVRVRFQPVPGYLIQAAITRIPDPDIPIMMNEEKGREEENPFDPEYTKSLNNAMYQRGIARIDTLIFWGIELVDGVPDGDWLDRLRFQEKMGYLDLSSFDLDNPIEVEFVYKKYIAVGNVQDGNGLYIDLELLSEKTSISRGSARKAEQLFRGDTERAIAEGTRATT